MKIQMVDVRSQYLKIKEEVDRGIAEVLETTSFINGPKVHEFQKGLETYLDVRHVIPCANGTDALQIAMMALDLKSGDEVILPAFTYVATAEVIALLGLRPVMVDVDMDTFNISLEGIEAAISPKTRAIVPVHLYGQSAYMEGILKIAHQHGIHVIEDNAQAIGADYTFSDGRVRKTGIIGDIGCTSFYPSKNLGCYGDGGAMMTNDDILGRQMHKIANHGQSIRYYHDIVGCNSRLDSMQAAVLNAKLKHLDAYCRSRISVANYYDHAFEGIDAVITPYRAPYSTHVFHQYTLRIMDGSRDKLKEALEKVGIPTMIYYPVPLYRQKAFETYAAEEFYLPNTEVLCQEVLSLPIHTEMNSEQLDYIVENVTKYFS
jgi:UDP-2-acetamido-2-deoxy-ribo-hexuluronate aminotransferase